jgi:hypothetical protein
VVARRDDAARLPYLTCRIPHEAFGETMEPLAIVGEGVTRTSPRNPYGFVISPM